MARWIQRLFAWIKRLRDPNDEINTILEARMEREMSEPIPTHTLTRAEQRLKAEVEARRQSSSRRNLHPYPSIPDSGTRYGTTVAPVCTKEYIGGNNWLENIPLPQYDPTPAPVQEKIDLSYAHETHFGGGDSGGAGATDSWSSDTSSSCDTTYTD